MPSVRSATRQSAARSPTRLRASKRPLPGRRTRCRQPYVSVRGGIPPRCWRQSTPPWESIPPADRPRPPRWRVCCNRFPRAAMPATKAPCWHAPRRCRCRFAPPRRPILLYTAAMAGIVAIAAAVWLFVERAVPPAPVGSPSAASQPAATAPPEIVAPAPATSRPIAPAPAVPDTAVAEPPVPTRPIPAPALPEPTPPAPFGIADARALALAVPCAFIDVRQANDVGRFSVSGPALPGAVFDTFVGQLRGPDRSVNVATVSLNPAYCPVIAVLADLVGRSRENGPLRLAMPDAAVPVRSGFVVTAHSVPAGVLYVDLYGTDGAVRHLLRRAVTSGTGSVQVDAVASGPPGQHLMVAIATAAPPDLAQRPATENATAYLQSLQNELARMTTGAATPARAEIAIPPVVTAAPATALPARPQEMVSAPSHGPSLNNSRCREIVARVQLGEALSDADRSALRNLCKP